MLLKFLLKFLTVAPIHLFTIKLPAPPLRRINPKNTHFPPPPQKKRTQPPKRLPFSTCKNCETKARRRFTVALLTVKIKSPQQQQQQPRLKCTHLSFLKSTRTRRKAPAHIAARYLLADEIWMPPPRAGAESWLARWISGRRRRRRRRASLALLIDRLSLSLSWALTRAPFSSFRL